MWLYIWIALYGSLNLWKALLIAVAGTAIIYASTLIAFSVLYFVVNTITQTSNNREG